MCPPYLGGSCENAHSVYPSQMFSLRMYPITGSSTWFESFMFVSGISALSKWSILSLANRVGALNAWRVSSPFAPGGSRKLGIF